MTLLLWFSSWTVFNRFHAGLCFCFFQSRRLTHFPINPTLSHQFPPLLGWAGLPQSKDISTYWYFPPDTWSWLRHKLPRWVHHQNPVGSQTIHQAVRRPPFGSPLLKCPHTHVKVRGMMGSHRGIEWRWMSELAGKKNSYGCFSLLLYLAEYRMITALTKAQRCTHA